MDNLEEMDKFLERDNLPRLNQEEIENQNRPIMTHQKLPHKEKPRTWWLYWWILWNIWRKINTNLSQALPKNWKEGKTSKIILWSWRYPDSKVKQGHCEKRKLQANIPDEYESKRVGLSYSQHTHTRAHAHAHTHTPETRWGGDGWVI